MAELTSDRTSSDQGHSSEQNDKSRFVSADPDRNPHLPRDHWHVANGTTDWLPELSPHYPKRKVKNMTPANFRRWRRVLLWSITVSILLTIFHYSEIFFT